MINNTSRCTRKLEYLPPFLALLYCICLTPYPLHLLSLPSFTAYV